MPSECARGNLETIDQRRKNPGNTKGKEDGVWQHLFKEEMLKQSSQDIHIRGFSRYSYRSFTSSKSGELRKWFILSMSEDARPGVTISTYA